jgi:phytol kinase
MTNQDIIGLVVSFLYAFSLLGIAELIRRIRHYSHDFTRKLVHIGAGLWVFGVLAIFDHWYIGIIPFASFIVLNYLTYRYRLIGAVDDSDSTPGTVYFAFSITLLFLLFWRTNSPDDRGYIAAAGAMAMTWGDAMASIIGRRFGRHKYVFRGDTRSWEGSTAMVSFSFVAIFLVLSLVPGSSLAPWSEPFPLSTTLPTALVAALVAAVAEGLSPRGTDNISVPLLSAATIWMTTSFLA